jgi:hypothetical protein
MKSALTLLATAASVLLASPVGSETVNVKYRGAVDLKPFACTDTPRSSFIQRVCYDQTQGYLLINLRGTYYHYCEMPPTTFDAFATASSMGQFYNRNIKRQRIGRPFRLPDTSSTLLLSFRA